MEIVLIILAGAITGAFNVAFFIVGYILGNKDKGEESVPEGVELTNANREMIEAMVNFNAYNGTIGGDQ